MATSATKMERINQELSDNEFSQRRPDSANVLIVDDDPNAVRLTLEILARKGIHANLADSKKVAIDFLDRNDCDLAFISEKTIHANKSTGGAEHGFELLNQIKAQLPELPVVMLANEAQSTGRQVTRDHKAPSNSSDSRLYDLPTMRHISRIAVHAIHAGCCDVLIKPLQPEKVERLIDAFLPNHQVRIAASAQEGSRYLYQIVGRSPKLVQTVNLARKVAPTSAPVLISGESGTGKELISYLIHHESRRSLGPYVAVNCAALSDSLLESELFGHEKGAFTGAHTQRKGRFEMADGGTLLLDEITETPLRFQAKLLRVLEQQQFERVGGNERLKVNVRIISTTNKDLLHEVQQGRFRQDLYYRLSAVRLVVSPLRRRLEDLPELTWHFVNLYAREAQRRITKLDPTMMDIFAEYHWPGNIRQLRNVVLTSLVMGIGPTLSLADVSWLFDELQPRPQQNTNAEMAHMDVLSSDRDSIEQPSSGLGGIPLQKLERQAILDTLRQTAGNQAKAARVLGISDRTLRDKIRRYRQSAAQLLIPDGCSRPGPKPPVAQPIEKTY
jgi:two-component system response regulator HydG